MALGSEDIVTKTKTISVTNTAIVLHWPITLIPFKAKCRLESKNNRIIRVEGVLYKAVKWINSVKE